jgi:hypothetical protein
VLEAMSAGLPVVASDLPVFREYLRPGQDALMVPVDDPTALAARIGAVLDDAALAGRLRTAGVPGVRPLHLGPVRGRAPADLRRPEVAMISCMSWLVPAAGPVRDRLAGVIAGLAAEHGTPVFAPHVTMADVAEAEPDAAARVLERVVAGVPPFEVALTGFGHEPEFFRSLYLRAEPSARLTGLHEKGQRAWGLALRLVRRTGRT